MARDVEDDEGAYDELLALGVRAVPTTVIDGRAIAGFDEAALREALSARASGSTGR